MNVYLNHNSNQSKQNNTKPTFTNTDQMTYLQNHLQAMRELFLFRIAKGDFKDITQAVVQAKQLNIQTENCHYAVTVISPEDDGNTLLSDLALCVLHDKIKNNHFAEEHLLASGLDGNNRLICIIQVAAPYADTEKHEKTLFSLLNSIAKETSVRMHYGIGAFVDRIELLPESYQLAMSILENAVKLENNAAFEAVGYYLKNSEEIHSRLLELFRDGDANGICELVRHHVEMIRLNIPGRQVLIERFAVMYLQNITNECMRLGITLERFESYVPAVVHLMQLDSTSSIESLLQLTEQILKYISVHRTKESNHLLTMAKDYIRENMSNDKLDLATVGDHVGLSRVYFCKLFHQLEGISFGSYLKQVRIEKAKQLLLTTNMKVFEVSNAVGFSHAKYFGQVFKDAVGQTPIEYQKGKKEH